MARVRKVINDARDYQRALELERRAMLALVTRLLNDHLPFATVKVLCALVASDVAFDRRPASDTRPGLLWSLGAEAIEPVALVIDERIESER